jgi:spermidine/putrescine transport system ATP-binding protein
MSGVVELVDLEKSFGDVAAVDRINLKIEDGEFFSLLGPSGCGKTTTLRLIAGFERPDGGAIMIDGVDQAAIPPHKRPVNTVFQSYALFPHMDVAANVSFGLRYQNVTKAEEKSRVGAALERVRLSGMEGRKPTQLSGGQQQRVALARALAPEPRVLLLDEPLSNLDPSLRERTRREIRELIRRVGITTVLVTHEQDEAFDLGDRVAVLRGGRLEQVGTPEDLYASPANEFVAEFVGRSSGIGVVVLGPGERGLRVVVEGVEWDLTDVSEAAPGPALMVVRPEALRLMPPAPGALVGTVTERRFTGPASLFTVVTDGGASLEVTGPPRSVRAGERVGIMPSRRAGGGIHLFPRAVE